MSKRGIIVGASSDIGRALAVNWLSAGWQLVGTYRTLAAPLTELSGSFTALVPCDLSAPASIEACAEEVRTRAFAWDVLVMCPGTLEPIGRFSDCDADAWEQGLAVNLLGPLRLLNRLLPLRNPAAGSGSPLVLFFAGGGTNSAPLHYSSYTTAKIALIKATELLDAEMPDVRFTILGPGWVKTKIHQQTLDAGDDASAGAARQTEQRLATNEFVPMEQVVECCDWLVGAPKALIGGRNFSAAHDFRDTARLETALRADPGMFKLRRAGNDRLG